jgi:hypothetical protein
VTAPATLPLGWTQADQAELDVLLAELVGAGFAHRDCARCCSLGTWCAPMAEAFEAVADWRWRRSLLSRAHALREKQSDREALVALLSREVA